MYGNATFRAPTDMFKTRKRAQRGQSQDPNTCFDCNKPVTVENSLCEACTARFRSIYANKKSEHD